jgi:restriction endonuclease S subunit
MSSLQTQLVKKTAIIESGDFNLSASRYLEKVEINSEFDIVSLNDFITFLPKSKRKSGDGQENGDYNFFVSSQTKIKKFDTFDYIDESIILGTGGQASIHIDEEFSTSADTFILKSNDQSVLTNKFIYHLLRGNINILEQGFRGGGLKHLSKDYVKNINIPLPPLEIQEQIVKEIEGYQQIIDGCKQVVENYKPVIDIDPSWEIVNLSQLLLDIRNGANFSSNQKGSGVKVLSVKDFEENSVYININSCQSVDLTDKSIDSKLVSPGDILVVRSSGSDSKVGSIALVPETNERIAFNGFLIKLKVNPKKMCAHFLFALLQTTKYRNLIRKSANKVSINNITQDSLKSLVIPLPSINIQNKIVEKLEQEREVIEGNKELIKIYEKKINDKIKELF